MRPLPDTRRRELATLVRSGKKRLAEVEEEWRYLDMLIEADGSDDVGLRFDDQAASG